MSLSTTINARINLSTGMVEFCVQAPDGSGDVVVLSLPADVVPNDADD